MSGPNQPGNNDFNPADFNFEPTGQRESASEMARRMERREERGEDLSGLGLRKQTRKILLAIFGAVMLFLGGVWVCIDEINQGVREMTDGPEEKRVPIVISADAVPKSKEKAKSK
jgi:hypothetical protein